MGDPALHGGLRIEKMRKYTEREEFRGIFDRLYLKKRSGEI
jgi:hypothetical protein